MIRLPSSALTAEELKDADSRNIGTMIAPLHFLEVKLGKRPQPEKSELDEEEERRKSPDPDPDPDPDARLEKGTVPGPAVPTHRDPAQSCPEWQPGCILAGPAGGAVGTRRGRPSKAHTH
ncbi:hypothetical protein QTO34_014735 [Cnephaeus nilssonii]|uniref:Uncharacterized protein n=1 Tax=Cnephaeus nilssonii TaxID=3371016 RepID=A0AA40I6Y3_CNENI|nr:hypothetical protein QTO34_014735 [Eptesicus nilssonii]